MKSYLFLFLIPFFFASLNGEVETPLGVLQVGSSFFPKQFNLCQTPAGRYLVRVNDQHIGWVMKQGRHWEEDLISSCSKYITPNSIVIDIGANIGTHTIPWSKKAARVYAFEPQRLIFQQLCANLLLNNVENVYAFPVALGHSNGKAHLDSTVPSVPGFSPQRSLTYTADQTLNYGGVRLGRDGEGVEMRTLDSYELDNVSLIKTDVEGAEALVFYGARETIKKNKPVIVYEKREDYKVTDDMKTSLNLSKEVSTFDIEAFVAKELPNEYEPPRNLSSNGDRILIPKR
jgi:FkbM family methyltransferase